MNEKSTLLTETLERLKALYESEGLASGPLRRIVVKPAWNIALGGDSLSGMAMNFTGFHDIRGYPRPDPDKLGRFIGADLFDAAERGIGSSDINEVSVGVACLSALSQPLLEEKFLAKRW